MKQTKRLAVLAMATVFAVGGLASCGSDKKEDELIKDPNTLRIFAWEGGYGSEWIHSIAKGFEAAMPGITVDVTTTPLRDKVQLEWEVSATSNRYDVLMVDGNEALVAYTKYRVPGVEYAFAQIDDVFAMKPVGEENGTLTVADKMIDGLPEYYTQFDVNENKTFSFPTVSTSGGWIYNEEVLNDCGVSVPRTTDEFIEVCQVIKSKGYTPIIFGGGTDYYTGRFQEWWIQYNGNEDFVRFQAGQAYDEMMGDYRYSPDIFDQKGRLYSLEVLEALYGYKGGESDSNCFIEPDAVGYRFMDAQQRFMDKDANGKYKYAFMSNGGWIENEMREFFSVGSVPLNKMQTPLLSALVYADKTKDRNEQTPIMTEAQLRECVSYFRGESEKPVGVSDVNLQKMHDAYFRVTAGTPGYNATIPSTSKKINLAKKFLSYMYSDDAIERVAKANCGAIMCADYDYSNMEGYSSLTTLQKNILDSMSSIYAKNITVSSHPIKYKGGLSVLKENIFQVFAAKNSTDRKTALQVYTEHGEYYKTGTAWQDLLIVAGLV